MMLCTAMLAVLGGGITAFAGEWKTDAKGYWYAKDDGSYASSEWIADEGKWYYIGDDGYMVSNAWIGDYYVGTDGAILVNTTTPDGYQVGADGAWIQENNVQAGYLEKYAEVLRNVLHGIPQGGENDYFDEHRFQLVYVDGDAVPELVIFGCTKLNYRTNTCLYTYYQGDFCMLRDFYARDFSYVHQGNWMKSVIMSSGSTIGDEGFYTINNGMIVPTAEFSDAYDKYSINRNEVSKFVYDSQLNAMKNGYLFKEVNETTTHELNEENIQKMLVDMNSAM